VPVLAHRIVAADATGAEVVLAALREALDEPVTAAAT
jgi:hypothetical protein